MNRGREWNKLVDKIGRIYLVIEKQIDIFFYQRFPVESLDAQVAFGAFPFCYNLALAFVAGIFSVTQT